jgi:hypothetical protein
MTTPRKNGKPRYPFRHALSSPVYQPTQDSAIALRGANFRGTLDIAAGEDADDESPKRKSQLRPFPMTASKLKAADRAPREKITHTQHAYPDNDRNISFPGDLEMLEDDSRQQRPPMLIVRVLTVSQFLWENQWIHPAFALSVMRNFQLTLRRFIALFSKLLGLRPIQIHA